MDKHISRNNTVMNSKTKKILFSIFIAVILGIIGNFSFPEDNKKVSLFYIKTKDNVKFMHKQDKDLYEFIFTLSHPTSDIESEASDIKPHTEPPKIKIIKNGEIQKQDPLPPNIKVIANKIKKCQNLDSFEQWLEELRNNQFEPINYNIYELNAFEEHRKNSKKIAALESNTTGISTKISNFIFFSIGISLVILFTIWFFWDRGFKRELQQAREHTWLPQSLPHFKQFIEEILEEIESSKKIKKIEKITTLKIELKNFQELISELMEIQKNPAQRFGDEDYNQLEKRIKGFSASLKQVIITVRLDKRLKPLKFELDYCREFIENEIPLIKSELLEKYKEKEDIEFLRYRAHKPQSLPDAVLMAQKMVQEFDDEISKNSSAFFEKDETKKKEEFEQEKHKKLTQFLDSSKKILEQYKQNFDFEHNMETLINDISKLEKSNTHLMDEYHLFDRDEKLKTNTEEAFQKIVDILQAFVDDYSQYSTLNSTLSISTKALNESIKTLRKESETMSSITGDLDSINTNEKGFLNRFQESVEELEAKKEALTVIATNLETHNERLSKNSNDINDGVGVLQTSSKTVQEVVDNLRSENSSLTGLSNRIKENEKHLTEEAANLRKNINSLIEQYKKAFDNAVDTLTQFTSNVTTLQSASNDVSKVVGILEKNTENSINTNNTMHRDFKEYLTNLLKKNHAFQEQLDSLEEQIKINENLSKELLGRENDLKTQTVLLNYAADAIQDGNKIGEKVANRLQSKATGFLSGVEQIESKFVDLKHQVKYGKAILDRMDKRLETFREVVEKEEIIFKGFEAININAGEVTKKLVRCTSDLAPKMLKVDSVLNSLEALEKEGDGHLQTLTEDVKETRINAESIQGIMNNLHNLGNTSEDVVKKETEVLNTLTNVFDAIQKLNNDLHSVSKRLEETEKKIEKKIGGNKEESEKLRDIINEGLLLNLTSKYSIPELSRLIGEPPISREYRAYATNLQKELKLLEKKYEDEWFWQVIKPLRDGVEDTIRFFYNRDGKTIYDSYLPDPEAGLAGVGKDEMRAVISRQHWGQIWEPLLRAYGFLKGYFNEELLDITELLGGARQKIINMMENHLGYKIDAYTPLQMIPKSMLESGEVTESSNHFIFFGDIMRNLKDNKRLLEASSAFNGKNELKLILYVDKFGLVENGKRIQSPKLVFYSDASMKHYKK